MRSANANWEPLDKDKVEFGTIFRQQFQDFGSCCVGKLMLQPHSKIKNHKHLTNSEIYIDTVTGKIVSKCNIGESHEYENCTDNVQVLLYVQTTGSLF